AGAARDAFRIDSQVDPVGCGWGEKRLLGPSGGGNSPPTDPVEVSPAPGRSSLACRPGLRARGAHRRLPADQLGDEDGDVELAEDRLEDRQGPGGVLYGDEVAVADGGEGGEAEVGEQEVTLVLAEELGGELLVPAEGAGDGRLDEAIEVAEGQPDEE